MLGYEVAAALPEMRRQAESLMVDAGELRGPDTDGPMDDNGNYPPKVPGPLRYAGRAKIQTTDTIGNDADAGEQLITVSRFEVHLPMSAPQAAVDDVWTVTASANDPQLVGKRFRVASLIHKSYMTARRLAVEEDQG